MLWPGMAREQTKNKKNKKSNGVKQSTAPSLSVNIEGARFGNGVKLIMTGLDRLL